MSRLLGSALDDVQAGVFETNLDKKTLMISVYRLEDVPISWLSLVCRRVAGS